MKPYRLCTFQNLNHIRSRGKLALRLEPYAFRVEYVLPTESNTWADAMPHSSVEELVSGWCYDFSLDF